MATRERMQVARRHDPYHWTWEPFAMWAMALATLTVLGVQAGRAIANWTAGAGLMWPSSAHLVSSTVAVLTGDPAAGLARPVPARLASTQQLHLWLVLTELLVLIGFAVATVLVLRAWGPWRVLGMASREEAERLLGRTRLRRVAGVVRPDLYGTRQGQMSPPPQHHTEAGSPDASAGGFGASAETTPIGGGLPPRLLPVRTTRRKNSTTRAGETSSGKTRRDPLPSAPASEWTKNTTSKGRGWR